MCVLANKRITRCIFNFVQRVASRPDAGVSKIMVRVADSWLHELAHVSPLNEANISLITQRFSRHSDVCLQLQCVHKVRVSSILYGLCPKNEQFLPAT